MTYYAPSDWMDEAPCLSKASFMWFPPLDIEEQDKSKFYELGRSVCMTCLVWQECLERGDKEAHGMWGGLTPLERRRPSKSHGSWIDYRRGCECNECSTAQRDSLLSALVDTDSLPDKHDLPPDDLGGFLFNLLN